MPARVLGKSVHASPCAPVQVFKPACVLGTHVQASLGAGDMW